MNWRKSTLFLGVTLGGAVIAGGIILAASGPITSSVTVGNAAPVVSSVVLNTGTPIVLTANATTPINVNATISDNNGCSDVTGGTAVILLYRTSVTSSTCNGSQNPLNCYKSTSFTTAGSCSGNSENTTTTFNVQYFAQPTDASSSFSSDNWTAMVLFTDPSAAVGSATATQELNTLNAINITTSSINYGTLAASSTSPTNPTTTIANAGNSSTTLNLSGTAFVSGANNFATSSQHYATSSFTYGTGDVALSDVPTAVSGFTLTAPTSTTITAAVASTMSQHRNRP